jgi:hypothetical protein
MQESELELYTTRELVDELMRRSTFLGVVVQAAEEMRGAWDGEKIFQVHYNSNLEREEVYRLLDAVTEHMSRDLGA